MITQKEGTIRAKIARKGDSIIERMVDESGQEAVTHYTVRAVHTHLDMSDVSLTLETGRTHQIRVHMQYPWSSACWRYAIWWNKRENRQAGTS